MSGAGSKRRKQVSEQEAQAITACQSGDREAFETIVRAYAARAIGAARSIVRETALAEDAAQEAFVRAFRALKRFDTKQPFYPWFYRILKNCCLSLLKRRKRHFAFSTDVEDAPPLEGPGGPANDPADSAARGELKAAVRQGMAQLSDPHREILYLSHFEALAYKEIADCLSIPIGTVMSRLWAARRALRKILEPGMGDHE